MPRSARSLFNVTRGHGGATHVEQYGVGNVGQDPDSRLLATETDTPSRSQL
jgi:hypothetical protein